MNKNVKIDQSGFWEEHKRRRSPVHPSVFLAVKTVMAYLKGTMVLDPKYNVLEVGCGNGFYSYQFYYYFPKLIATDFSDYLLSIHPLKGKIKLKNEDVTNLSYKDDSFDIVYCANLLHHVGDTEKAVSEMCRVSRKYVITIEPNINSPFMLFGNTLLNKNEWGSLKFTKKYLENLHKKQDMNIIASTPIGTIPPLKTPKFLAKLLYKLKIKNEYLSLYNVVISEK